MENEEKKVESSITENPIWQNGYETAIADLRHSLAAMYSANNKFAIRDVIMYLYRKIDFKNLYAWRYKNIWTIENLD